MIYKVRLEDLAVSSEEELAVVRDQVKESRLFNEDLAPAGPKRRTWGTWNLAALWVGLAICITTYTLASGLMAAGMNWWEALFTIGLGNLIVLVPLILNGHAGTRYGIPFPIFVRASFGTRGANIAALARALVACGWFGIQTWLGGLAVNAILIVLWPGWASVPAHEFIAFGVFWIVQMVVIVRGMESVRIFETWSAPLLLVVSLALLAWGLAAGGGIGHVFAASVKLQQGHAPFWLLFGPGLMANIGYWATLSLNIPDFTRFARSQRTQVWGQAIGLPLSMILFSFIGIAVTAATVVIYGHAVWNPVTLLTQIKMGPVLLILVMIVILIAQAAVNLGANVVAPSNDFSNVAPRRISFRTGSIITGIIGVVSFPWLLYQSAGAYIFTWLGGYGSLLGAIGGIMIADYWLVRHQRLELADLYKPDGNYRYNNGFNGIAIVALLVAVVPVIPGFIAAATTPGGVVAHPGIWDRLYTFGWLFTFIVSILVYWGLTVLTKSRAPVSVRSTDLADTAE